MSADALRQAMSSEPDIIGARDSQGPLMSVPAPKLYKALLLVIDGQVWKSAEEPSYTIMTMGTGGNHGGTYLELSLFDRGMAGRRFPVTEYESAVESAIEFALKRRDTDSVRMIRETPKVTVLDPTAFKIPTEASRLAGAEEQVRALVTKVSGLLSGPVNRDSLRDVKKLVEDADSLFWQHGLDAVSPTS